MLYVADASNLYTCDVDPQTFQPSLMGTIPLPKAQTLAWAIDRYEVNATNGRLTNVVNAATYLLPAQGTNDCDLSIVGMNARGTTIFDYESCLTHEGENGFYDERTVDPQTGALGTPQQIFSWTVGSIGAPESVQIIQGRLFAFASPIGWEPYNYLQIYPVTTNQNAKPLIDCTSTMLAACAADTGVAHPSAKYVFYTNAQSNTTEVDAVDLTSKQIIPTGTISIFGFDVSTAATTTGGSITGSIALILPAERR